MLPGNNINLLSPEQSVFIANVFIAIIGFVRLTVSMNTVLIALLRRYVPRSDNKNAVRFQGETQQSAPLQEHENINVQPACPSLHHRDEFSFRRAFFRVL